MKKKKSGKTNRLRNTASTMFKSISRASVLVLKDGNVPSHLPGCDVKEADRKLWELIDLVTGIRHF